MTPLAGDGHAELVNQTASRLERRFRIYVGLSVFLAGAYFFGGAASNQNARLNAMYAFAEPGTPDTGTFRIDRFMLANGRGINTLDWAAHGGHYYANKAPGTIWIGALVYTALLQVERLAGVRFDAPRLVIANAYIINLFVSVLPLVLAALCMFELGRNRGLTLARASWLALATTLGTLWFPYSTQIWGHTTAAAFAAAALVLMDRGTARAVAWAGCVVALAVCMDYLAAVSALAIAVWLMVTRPRLLPWLALGAAPPALALMAYHALCFGHPLVTASQLSNPAFLQQDRSLGMFGQLSLGALWSLTFGPSRGLFTQCPVLLLSLVGFYFWLRRRPRDALAYVCLATFAAYLVANASFNGWHGGATVGARYLICALPFLALALHAVPWSRPMAWTAAVLSAISGINMLAVAAVNPLAPEGLANPLYGYTYSMLLDGKLSPYPFTLRTLVLDPEWRELRAFAMWNAGELIGLVGLWSLWPLILGGAALTLWLRRPSAA